MQTTKLPGILALISLVLTILWLVFLILDLASAGPLETFAQVSAHVSQPRVIFYLSYINAALLTVSVSMLFAALYSYYKRSAPQASVLGAIFVPVYSAMNLIAYLSQITIVPRLLHLQALPEYQPFARFLLQQSLQLWPDSAVSVINNLAYAVLGIPSIVFGLQMLPSRLALRIGGILLALNGLACVAGFIGVAAQIGWLSNGSLLGGILFLAALVPLSWGFLHGKSGKLQPRDIRIA